MMRQLKNHVGTGDHGQRKRGENLVTLRGKQSRSSILHKEKHDGDESEDTENQWNEFTGVVGGNLHNPLFLAA